MLNNNENKVMENGYVVLPLEKYNELMKTVRDAETAAEKLIRLKVNYQGQVDINFDSEQIYAAAKKLYEVSELNTPERELIVLERFSVWASNLTEKPITTDEE